MKTRILIVLALILIGTATLAQQKPKPKEKAPSQKEIEEMLREAQNEMNAMSSEEKRMLDSMGFQMPDLKNIPKFTDKQIQDVAKKSDRFALPKKDMAKIGMINRKPLTSFELTLFIKGLSTKIEHRLDAKKLAAGKEAYAAIKAKYKEANAVATAASAYWMVGVLQPAIYLMGRACLDEPNNPDYLNNYAAFLTMAQAEESALPILISLNKSHRKNSTILNNLGHAWFGLGDVILAEKYLDSVIAIYPNHAQANYTKAIIEKSRGNKQGAISAMKRSIARAYSAEKDRMLRQLGYTLNGKDVVWSLPMPQDPLGLEKFDWPDYPKTVEDSKRLESEWKDFVGMCDQRKSQLIAGKGKIESDFNDAYIKMLQSGASGKGMEVPVLSKKASLKLDYVMSNVEGSMMNILKREEKALQDAAQEVARLEETKVRELQKIDDKFRPLMGEGKPNPFKDYCAALSGVQNNFLGSANPLLESRYKSFLRATERITNERAYYIQYTLPPDAMEGWKLNEKTKWLGYISSLHPVRFEVPSAVCQSTPLTSSQSSRKLAEFEDLHCPNIVELSIGLISWKMSCGKSYYEGGVGPIDFNLAYNDWKEEIIRGTVELGDSKSIGLSSGPMVAKLEGKLAGFIEFDNTGVTDVGIIAGVTAKAGAEIDSGVEYVGDVGRTINIGVTSRMGWNSGGSVNVFNN